MMYKDSTNKSSDLRLVVVANSVAILPCESGEPSADVTYNWSKDNLPVVTRNDGRIKTSDEGHLILKDTREEDSGVYICKTTDKEEVDEVNVTLIVLVSESAPYFYNFTEPNATIQRTEGSSVLFQCPVRGHPAPGITWLKNGIHIDTSELDSTTEYMKWSITLNDLKVTDSGNYTCFVANKLGSVNATFDLLVTKKEKPPMINSTRPDLSVFHPLNTTVKYGSSATFQCRVRSEAPPNIQWLKKVEDYELPKLQKQHHDIIKVQGENYRVLQSSEVVERSDGSFLNKLTIPEVFEADSGKYICLGANSMGYSFRSAYLTVLPRPRALPLGWSRSVAVHPGYPGSLLVAIPITLGVVVGVMVALVVLCHRRRLDNSVPLPASGYRKEDQKRASRTATTAFDNFKDDSIDNGLYSGDEAEDFKEEQAFLSRMQSEVELESSGSVVTKICMEQNASNNYDSCFIMRNEV
ncbi:fibroblast growth factor receptor-like 1 [Trichonephila inaurata madagascariensis]|uniref:receptor protein-tyrosine kinase n=1 Tax=Trichonephila inaurata madagascariensis TaxID=2747483 RepID=A0A8X7CIV0_9ARAC|nr:fibroblast growth factor receptor-like 1 [Trichonephila inaurata madagascariensis]